MIYSLSINPKIKLYPQAKSIIIASSHPMNNSTTKPLPEPSNPPSSRHLENQQQPPEQKIFKIRTFSSKLNHLKMKPDQIRQIQKQLTLNHNIGTSQTIDKIKGTRQRSYVSYKSSKQVANFKSNSKFITKDSNTTCLFDGVLINKVECNSIRPQIINLSKLTPLSHKPHVLYNDQSGNNAVKDIVLIVSMKTLNYQPTKYFRETGGRTSRNGRKNVENNNEPVYSMQTETFLKSFSNPANKATFLTQCRIFYKVNSSIQQTILKEYLETNNLLNYQGIIDISNKYSQQYTIYNLKGITSPQDTVIIFEEQQVLKSQFPLLQGDNAIIIANSAKGCNNYFMINQVINYIKDIQIKEEIEMSPIKMTKKRNKMDKIQEDKQNINPNIMYSTLKDMKSSAKKSKISPIKTIRKKQRKQFIINAKIANNRLELDEKLLFKKVSQSKHVKTIKNCLKQVRLNSINNVQQKQTSKSKYKRNKSLDRSRRIHKTAKQQHNSTINASNLQGTFKQKMIQYVKILQHQLAQKMKNKPIQPSRNLQKTDKTSQLDDLTSCLTSKIKSKTPFQLVGDLLRSNAHNAKQINKYLIQAKHIQNECIQYESIFMEKIQEEFQELFLQDIFYYKFQ